MQNFLDLRANIESFEVVKENLSSFFYVANTPSSIFISQLSERAFIL